MIQQKILQKNMNNFSKIAFTIGAGAFLLQSQFPNLIEPDSFISNSLNFIFVIGFFSAGLALMISGISSSSGEKVQESFTTSLLKIVYKAFLYVLLPAVLITIIISLIFLR